MKTIIHQRKSIRLREYDYSQPGEYFVTICTYNHECVFGNILDEEMKLSTEGDDSAAMLGGNTKTFFQRSTG